MKPRPLIPGSDWWAVSHLGFQKTFPKPGKNLAFFWDSFFDWSQIVTKLKIIFAPIIFRMRAKTWGNRNVSVFLPPGWRPVGLRGCVRTHRTGSSSHPRGGWGLNWQTKFDVSLCFETMAAICDTRNVTQHENKNDDGRATSFHRRLPARHKLTLPYVFEIIDQNKMLGYCRQDFLLAAAHRLFEPGP